MQKFVRKRIMQRYNQSHLRLENTNFARKTCFRDRSVSHYLLWLQKTPERTATAVTLQRRDTCYTTPHVTVSAGPISSPWLLTVFINGSLLWARLVYFKPLLCFQISFRITFNSMRYSQDKDMTHRRTLIATADSSPNFLFFLNDRLPGTLENDYQSCGQRQV